MPRSRPDAAGCDTSLGIVGRALAHLAHPGVVLFAAAIFSSAFLIFGVQPMVGKHVLPWFGGAPGVWMTCLAFYQSALFVGYAYAHGLAAKVSPARQPLFHAGLFVAALAVLPVLPGDVWKPEPAADATGLILVMLIANVALPFVLLASTGPLLQVWFARTFPGRSPYPLYAVSNLGSLLGLASCPFLVEPRIPLPLQSRIWSWGFAVTGIVILGCSWWATRVAPGSGSAAGPEEQPPQEAIGIGRLALWILLPASAVVMFMGVSNHLCLDVASVPFLWVLPLSVYLVTLIVCFASDRLYPRTLLLALAIPAFVLLAATTQWRPGSLFDLVHKGTIGGRIALHSSALFVVCMVAHGELHRLRPTPGRLTAFYLCVAGGGALGGIFVGVIAPRIFLAYHELPIGVAVCWALVLVATWWDPGAASGVRIPRVAWAGAAALGMVAGGLLAVRAESTEPGTLAVERNFFGVLRVIERGGPMPFVLLRNGTTRHGLQYTSPERRREPSSYYGRATGIGLVMADRTEEGRGPIKVGVVGLGVGTLAAWIREGDSIVFYEIDSDVVRIARDTRFFSYLEDADAEVEILVGDGRLSLEAELGRDGGRGFDVLVIDAFSSDAIPLHLLTYEAFQLYDAHLADGGVLAVHVSNKHLDLEPQVVRLGDAIGMHASVANNGEVPRHLSNTATWVVLSRDPAYIEVLSDRAERNGRFRGRLLTRVRRGDPRHHAQSPLWTDDYSNVFGALRASGD